MSTTTTSSTSWLSTMNHTATDVNLDDALDHKTNLPPRLPSLVLERSPRRLRISRSTPEMEMDGQVPRRRHTRRRIRSNDESSSSGQAKKPLKGILKRASTESLRLTRSDRSSLVNQPPKNVSFSDLKIRSQSRWESEGSGLEMAALESFASKSMKLKMENASLSSGKANFTWDSKNPQKDVPDKPSKLAPASALPVANMSTEDIMKQIHRIQAPKKPCRQNSGETTVRQRPKMMAMTATVTASTSTAPTTKKQQTPKMPIRQDSGQQGTPTSVVNVFQASVNEFQSKSSVMATMSF